MSKQGKFVSTTMTAMEAIDMCACAVEELAGEMSEWRDNLEDKFSSTEKYERVSEAADTLENSEVRSACDELQEAIDGLEGTLFRAGCPEHVVGTPCKRCGWKGILRESKLPAPVLVVPEKPIASFLPDLVVARINAEYGRTNFFTVPPTATAEEIAAEVQRARDVFSTEMEGWTARNAPENLIPRRLPDEPEVLPLEALSTIGSMSVTYQSFQPYKGRSMSRADRLSDATSAAMAGVEALKSKLEEYEATLDKDAEEDERVVTLRDALTQVEEAVSELDDGNVEFPGMYG